MPNLEQLVQEQIDLLEVLKVQLESELHLISSRDPESLTRLVNEKAETLDKIAEKDLVIKQMYVKLDDEDARLALDPLFDQAKDLVNQCKFRTEINEKAVEQGQLRLEHLRNLLLEARSKESMTYDKSGKPQGGSSGKGIEA